MIFTDDSFYIGDPCYVLTGDEYDELLAMMDTDNDPDSEDYDAEVDVNGKTVFVFSTKYGDGIYQDDEGKRYGVDSGLLCAMKVEDIEDKLKCADTLDRNMGQVYELPDLDAFGVGYRDGEIYFDTVTIDTNA